MTEINEHCQCDNCSGRDCGQDDPDKCNAEREALEKQHDEQVRKEERIKVIVELLDMSHGVWNLPDMQDRLRAMRDSLRKGAP